MAAVTGATSWLTGNGCFEIVTCVGTDHETYASKFSTIIFAKMQSRGRAEGYLAVSGGTVTIHLTGASDDEIDMFIVGY